MRPGSVVGSLPDGATSPDSTSASALPHSSPGNHACRIAGTSPDHGISTGDAAFTTTTVRGFAAATARIKSSCGGGQRHRFAVVALALPVVVGTDHAHRRRRRARPARPRGPSGRPGWAAGTRSRGRPGREAARSRPRSGGVRRRAARSCRPAPALPKPMNASLRPVGCQLSTTTSPSIDSRARPTCTSENVHSPVSGATTVPLARKENSSGTPCPTGPMNVNSPRRASSVCTGAPSRSRPA